MTTAIIHRVAEKKQEKYRSPDKYDSQAGLVIQYDASCAHVHRLGSGTAMPRLEHWLLARTGGTLQTVGASLPYGLPQVVVKEAEGLPEAGSDELVAPSQPGEYLKTGERFIRRLIAERRIVYVELGKYVRVERSVWDALIESGRVPRHRGAGNRPAQALSVQAKSRGAPPARRQRVGRRRRASGGPDMCWRRTHSYARGGPAVPGT